jgi:hypothetical protein
MKISSLEALERKIQKAIRKEDKKAEDRALDALYRLKENWRAFGRRARKFGRARKGAKLSEESRRWISESRKAQWKDPEFARMMFWAQRRRRFREQGKCLLRFPRLSASTAESEWLRVYRKRYHRVTGKRLRRSDITFDPPRETLPAES